MRLAYNTNGLAHHRLDEALRLLADLGYRGVALTLDVGHLDPYRTSPREVEVVAALCARLDLAVAVETGARFLLDPHRKHRPTLLEAAPEERARRADFLRGCIDIAGDLGAGVVSTWSGAAPENHGEGDEALWQRLVEALPALLDRARARGTRLAFEPEPGMFVERPAGYRELLRRLAERGPELGLTLDVGHCVVSGDLPVDSVVREFREELAHVHLDDALPGVHEHLMFGRGELDLPGALGALQEIGFGGLAAVELSRDGHRGAAAAAEALVRLLATGIRPG